MQERFLFILLLAAYYCSFRTAIAATGAVTFDFGTTVCQGSPFVFGACKFPMKDQQADFYPKLKETGVTFLRADFYFEHIIPTNKCASVSDYRNNVNGIQNPDTWEYRHLYWIDSSRKHGFKTFISATYTPDWLSCSGTYKGAPKDWMVWEDIVKKVYTRYKTRVDWVETWNEAEYFCDLTGSPYTSKEDFLVDDFYHTVKAIRDAGGTIPTGGFAFAYDRTDVFQGILKRLVAKYGKSWTEANLDFYSVHHYGTEPGKVNLQDIRNALHSAGLNPFKGVFVDEWNYTTDWGRGAGELHDAKAIGYVGKSLACFIKCGVNAAYYCVYPVQAPVLDPDLPGVTPFISGLGFYTTNGNSTTPLPQSYPFKVLSNRLGLGKGIYVVKNVSDQSLIDACCAINSAGQKVAFIANYYDSPNTVNIIFKGLEGRKVNITDYYANAWDPSCNAYSTITKDVSKGLTSHSINMVANTCVGLVIAPATNELSSMK